MAALEIQPAGDEPTAETPRANTATTGIRQSQPVCDQPHCHYCEGPETD